MGAGSGEYIVEDTQFLEDIGDLEGTGQAMPIQDVEEVFRIYPVP